AVINVGIPVAPGRADDRASLGIEEGGTCREMFGQVTVILQILLVAGAPLSNARMIADHANERLVKLGRSNGKGALLRLPRFQKILPEQHSQFIRQIVELRIA